MKNPPLTPVFWIFVIACIVSPFVAQLSRAQTTNWITSGTADWSDPTNWDAGVPTSTSTATIAASGTAVFLTGAGAYDTLAIGNITDGGLIVSDGALTGTTTSMGSLGNAILIISGGTLTSPTITVNSTPVFTGSVNLSSGVISSTSVIGNSGGATAAFTLNGGTLQASGNTSTLITSFPDGSVNIFGQTSTFDNNGFSVEIPQRLAGTGVLNSVGSGILVLSGSSFNTFSGSLINNGSGTMQFGNGVGGLNAMSNNITNNGTIIYNSGDSMTVLSTITGSGGLIKQGSTLLSLGANSTYTGDTVINGGGIRIGVALPGGSVGGNIILNGTSTFVQFNRTGSSTFSGTILGSGSVTVNPGATGFQTFTANNTYTGLTLISNGTFQIGNGGTTGALTSNITNNRTLRFNRSDTYTYSNVISGSGVVTQVGSGLLILTGNNTYTGTTIINSGVSLQVGNGSTTGALANTPVANSGTLTFNRSNAATYSGIVSGAGTVIQAGSGLLTLTGNNIFTGSMIISSGTLQLGSGATAGSLSTASISNGGVLVANRSNALTISGTIFGSGTFVQAGTGTTILTANSTYGGSTIINAGTLQLGNGGSTGSIMTSVIQNNGTFAIQRSDLVTFSGTILGTGAFRQGGTGTTVLTGNNTYSGSTIITSGVLQVGNGSTAGAISNTLVQNSGTLMFNRSDLVTYSGTIQGAGALNQVGTGTVILTEDNSYTGPTTVNAGALQIGIGAATGSIGSTLVQNASQLIFNRTGLLTFSATIQGSGSLTKASTGTLILTEDSTYTGDTTISAGSLQIGNGGATGSIGSTSVQNAGELVFNRTGSLTFSGTIQGSGPLRKLSTGTLVLTADNPYTGNTTISAGSLQIGNGGATGSIGSTSVQNAGELVFNRTGSLTFSGTIQGSGSLTKASSGTLVLTEDNPYTGATTITGGILQIGNGGATGSIGSTSVQNAGELVFNRTGSLTFSGTIQGSGSLTKLSTGTLVLTADNPYTGNTTISAGSLQIGNGGATGSIGSTSVQNAGELVFNRTGSLTFSGTIQGSGSLTKAGSGTLVLTEDNPYTGNTAINAGVLQLGNGGATGSIGSALVQNDGELIFNRTGSLTFSGTIQGSGALTKSGSGIVVLTANNGYAGNTTINEGTLQVGNGGITGSIGSSTFVQNQGTLAFNRSDTVTFSGTITGAGSLNHQGTGSLVLTGNNDYSGGTVIGPGTLQLGNGGTTGSIIGNIANSGILTVNRSDALSIPGSISGSGALIQAGSGATLLTGSNSYTGGTAIIFGTLIGTTLSIQGAVANNSNLVFSQSSTATFNGGIAGPGTVSINSPGGRINFNTNQSYTGSTAINGGELSVNASLSSATVIVNTSGTLSGIGTISGNIISNGGVINPGQSPGVLHVVGNYDQGSAATLVIEIAGSSSFDQLIIGGTANLDGTLEVQLLGGFVPSTSDIFTILTAVGGVSGTFSNLSFPPGFPLEVVYDPFDVQLRFTSTPPTPGPTPGPASGPGALIQQAIAVGAPGSTPGPAPSSGALIQQAVAVGAEIDEIALLLRLLDISLDELVPSIAGNIKDVIFNIANNQYGQITTRLSAIRSGVSGVALQGLSQEPMIEAYNKRKALSYNKRVIAYKEEENHWDIFASASGVFSEISNIWDLPGINSIAGLFCVGADYGISEYFNVGVYTGYQGFKSWYAGNSFLYSNGVKWGTYATAQWRGFYLNGIVGGGANFLTLNRNIDLMDTQLRARSNPFIGELDSLLGGGYEYRLGSWVFGANNSIQYTYLGSSSFTESGADNLNVRVGRASANSLMYTLGGNISYLWQFAPNYKILPTVGLSWQHEFLNQGQRFHAAFANGAGTAFYFNSPTASRNSAFGVAGITTQLGSHIGVWAYYTTQFGGGQIYANAVQLGLTYEF